MTPRQVERLSKLLLALPRYAFALTFGASLVATVFIAVITLFIALLPVWPADAGVSRVVALMWIALAECGLVAIVVASWAFGKLDNFSFSAGMVSASVDFQDDHPRPHVDTPPTPRQDPPF